MTPDHTTPDRDPSNQPLWRKQFPVDTASDAEANRRGFIGGLAVAGVTMGIGAGGFQTFSKPTANESGFTAHEPLTLEKKLPDMADGEAQLFHFPDHRSPCLLVKLSSTEFVAFSQKCTHLACPVIPRADVGEFHCPCHKGVFDLKTGKPKSGPPQTALPQVQVTVAEDGTLSAVAVETGIMPA